MRVIDVSDWQERVEWDLVKTIASGAIVKSFSGRTMQSMFYEHINNAVGRGLQIGTYLYTYAQTTERAQEEAENLIAMLDNCGLTPRKLPLLIWFDVEEPSVIGQSADDVTAVCSKFISTCNANGYNAGIYASLSTLVDRMNLNQLADYVPIWCAQYSSHCNFNDYFPDRKLKGWQFTETYEIGSGYYDMSVFYE